MKKLLFTLLIGISTLSYAQAPQKISYQGVARTVSGTVLANQPIGIKFDIHQGSAAGPVVFTETHTGVSTNGFGLFTTYIGSISNLAVINWAANSYFIEVSIDPNTGTFSSLGSQQLMSVPYALNAGSAPAPTVTFTNNTLSVGGNTTTIPAGITYTAGTGINVTGSTISNTAPDQTVVLNAAGATTVTGTYPSFTINTPTTQVYTAGNGIDITSGVISNTAAAVTPTIVGTGATTVTGTYPNLTINSPTVAPDQTVVLNAAGATTVTGTYPSFTINTPTTQVYSAGNGIDITSGVISNTATAVTPTIVGTGATTVTGTYPNLTINTPTVAPDQAVSLTGTGNATVTGAYPNFTVNVPSGSALPNAFSGQFLYNTGTVWDTLPRNNLYFDGTNFGIGTTAPQANFHVVGAGKFDASVSTPHVFTNTLTVSGGTLGQVLTSDGSGNGTFQNLPAATTSTITSTGIAVVTPTTGNTFNVDVPVPVLSYTAGTNVLSLTQGTTVTTATLNGTGSSTVSIVGVGLATVTPTTGSTFTVSVPNPTLSVGSGSLSISNGNSVPLPTQSLSINSNSLTISGAGGNTVVLPSASTTSLTQGSNVTVAGSAPNYTVSAPAYSISLPGGNTVQITNGVSTSTAAIATTSLTLGGTNNNILSAGGNTVALNTYTAGTGIAISGTAPNYTLSSPNQSLTINSNSLSITGGNTITLPTSSTTTLTQGANVTVTGSAPSYTVSSVTPTLSVVGGTLTGSYPTQTLTVPTSSTTVLTQSTGISVLGSAPSYTLVNTAPAVTQSLTGTGISSVTAAANTFTVNTPMPTYTQTTGVLSFGGTNTVVATPSLSLAGNILRSGPATNTVTLPVTVLTGTGTGIATVTTAVSAFTVNVPSPTYTAATGVLSFGGTNTVVITPTLSLTGTTLTSGAATNSVNLSSLNGIYGGSGSIQTGSTTVTVGTNTLTFLSGATLGKPIANFFGGGITGTHLAVGHVSTNPATIKLLGSVSTAPVDYGYVSGSSNGISISGGTSSNGLYATNTAEVGVGTFTTGTGKFVITHTASQADPTMHLRETTNGAISRIKFSNTGIANKYFETGAQTNAVDGNGAYTISYFDGTTYKPVLAVTGDRKVNINNLNTVLASLHVMENATTAGGGIVSEGFARPGQMIIARNNQPALAARTAIVAADEIGKISFSGFNGGGFNDGGIISVVSTEAFTGSTGGSNMFFRVTPTGTINTQDIFKLGGDGNVTVNPNNSFTKTLLDVKGRLRVDSSLTMAAYNTPPNTSFGNEGRIYYDRPTNKFKVSENGGVYVDLIPGAGSSPWTYTTGVIAPLNNPSSDRIAIGQTTANSLLDVFNGAGSGVTTNAVAKFSNANNAFSGSGVLEVVKTDGFGALIYATNTHSVGDGLSINMSNATNGSNAVQIQQFGIGNAGYFDINNASNNASAIAASSNGGGKVISAITTGNNGEAGDFFINNATNASPAIAATTNGIGDAVLGQQMGTGGRAGAFATFNNTNSSHTLFSQTAGLGAAGFFEVINNSSNNNAVSAHHYGTGATILGNNYGSGNAGSFAISNATSTANALQVSTNGMGPAAYISNSNASNFNSALQVNQVSTGVAIYATNSNTGSGSTAQFDGNNGSTTFNAINYAGGEAINANSDVGTALRAHNTGSTPTIYANNSGVGDVMNLFGAANGQRAIYASNNSTTYSTIEASNGGLGPVYSGAKAAGATGGNVANFSNSGIGNGADVLLVTNSGGGAAIHAISAATSSVALWVENGHVKATGVSVTTGALNVSGGFVTPGIAPILTNCNDVKGTFSFTTSVTGIVAGAYIELEIRFAKPYVTIPTVVASPVSDLQGLNYMVTNTTAASFFVRVYRSSNANITLPTTIVSGSMFKFNYMVIE